MAVEEEAWRVSVSGILEVVVVEAEVEANVVGWVRSNSLMHQNIVKTGDHRTSHEVVECPSNAVAWEVPVDLLLVGPPGNQFPSCIKHPQL
jgi:hypothetical protein